MKLLKATHESLSAPAKQHSSLRTFLVGWCLQCNIHGRFVGPANFAPSSAFTERPPPNTSNEDVSFTLPPNMSLAHRTPEITATRNFQVDCIPYVTLFFLAESSLPLSPPPATPLPIPSRETRVHKDQRSAATFHDGSGSLSLLFPLASSLPRERNDEIREG